MTFHLHHPILSLQGKKKKSSKVKFRNAAEAQRARELKQEWNEILKRHGATVEKKSKNSIEPLSKHYSLSNNRNSDNSKIKSLGQDNGVAVLKPTKMYTGTECIGVSVIHKSCLQPIFSRQDAVDVAKMRR